jgi:transposase
VKEYQAEMLEDKQGNRYVAAFPEGITRPIQYGQSVKAHAVYMSQFQLIPYERVADYFSNEIGVDLSVGTLFNFNTEAYNALERFEQLVKEQLTLAPVIHFDETGINLNGKKHWLLSASNHTWSYLYPHAKRGREAMDAMGILPTYKGTAVHDHFKSYYGYKDCVHALCNAHHLRELQWVIDHTDYAWAKTMQDFLHEINDEVKATKQQYLNKQNRMCAKERYRAILQAGSQEMPPCIKPPGTKGRLKKTKAWNLLERLKDYENDVLRFIEEPLVPFTNNPAENDIRMTKVQQKISGCFRSVEGAKIFCRVRSYVLTAKKHGVNPSNALRLLFAGKLPSEFTIKPK